MTRLLQKLSAAAVAVMAALPSAAKDADTAPLPDSLYEMKARSIDGEEVALSRFKGKVALVVNTASKCGFTPQYKALEALYEKYKDQGLVVLGFPSNDFMFQEPGKNAEIKTFCELKYGVTFPLFEKDHVLGKLTQPVYRFLKASPLGKKDGEISWNFTKFLVGPDGKVAARFATKVPPDSPDVLSAIEALLKTPAAKPA